MANRDDVSGKLFLGGVSWETSEDTLRRYFEKFGKLIDCAVMKDKQTGKPRGFGFVQYDDPSVVDKILAEQHILDGRTLDIKKAISREEAPRGPGTGKLILESKKIFVGGLDLTVTEADFREYFAKFGEITDAVVMVDKETDRSRGFGFVTFTTEQAVKDVLRGNHELKGKFVEIKQAEPRESRQFGSGSGRGRSDRGGRGGRGSFGRGGGYGQDYSSAYGSYGGGAAGYGGSVYGGYSAGMGTTGGFGGPYGGSGGYGASYGAPSGYSGAGYGGGYASSAPFNASSFGYGPAGFGAAYGGSGGYGAAVSPAVATAYGASTQGSSQNRDYRSYKPY